ncbi:MAG TPA: ABC transporter permease [Acidimicrobiales bacterium]|nr:ABC transporter permease [Acidimicrobiales bacterium]
MTTAPVPTGEQRAQQPRLPSLGDLRRMVPDMPRWPFTFAATFLVAWAILSHVLSRGLPPGIVVMGLVFGSFYAMVAVGLVLVYRASRIINFAQANTGVLAAILAIEMVIQWGLNFFVAVFLGLAIGLGIGALINVAIVRRFRRAPRLILTVATIGIDQVLTALALIIPLLIGGAPTHAKPFTTPLSAKFTIYPVVFTGNHILALIAAAGAAVALGLFLRYSSYGIAIRAAAENGERALLLGIPVPRLDTIVWALAGLLSALAVLMRVPVLGFNSFGSVSGGGNSLLLRTLAAAVIGRMENLPRTVAAALGIGVFESLATWTSSNVTIVDASLVGVIVIALLVQRGAFSRMVEGSLSSFKAIREIRPIPAELRRLPEVRIGVRGLQLVLVGFALLLPVIFSTSQTYLAALVLIYAMVGLSLLILTGWAGQVSLGQFALAGFGGATTALLYQRHGWDFFLALIAGVLVSSLVALVIGLPALRIRGPFLAVTTLAFAVSASEYFLNGTYLPWFVQPEMSRPNLLGRVSLASDTQIYYFVLVGLVLVIAAVRSLRKSRTGRAIIATRDNEPTARAAKIDTTRIKLTAFVLSGAVAGFAGALYVMHENGVYSNSFSADTSITLFAMVVIGGLGSIPGVILGAVYVWGATYFLHGGYSELATGIGILFLLMFFPDGLGGIMYGLRDTLLRRVAKSRGLIVPSLLADQRQYDVGAEVLLSRQTEAAAAAVVAAGGPAGNGAPPAGGPPTEEQPVLVGAGRGSRRGRSGARV